MAAQLKLVTSEQLTADDIMQEVSRWKITLVLDLFLRIFQHLMMSISERCPANPSPVYTFARSVKTWLESSTPSHMHPNPQTALMATQILALKKGPTGPERALLGAVRLFHERSEANARSINAANDSCKGGYIANISTAIASNLKDALLEEIPGDGQLDYRVTPQGFAYFDYLFKKWAAQVQEAANEPEELAA